MAMFLFEVDHKPKISMGPKIVRSIFDEWPHSIPMKGILARGITLHVAL